MTIEDKHLPLVLAAFKKKHPDIIPHVKALSAMQGTPVAAAATALLQCLLEEFDDAQQLKWQMRDMLQRVHRKTSTYEDACYWALKYSATKMVHLLTIFGEADTSKTTYYQLDKDQPDVLKNWKSEIPTE